MTYKLIITGFETQAQVDEFCSWYSNSGEQDAMYSFEERCSEGVIDVNSMNYVGSFEGENFGETIMEINPK
jgi:hypothetical protein